VLKSALNSSMSRVIGGHPATTEPIGSENCHHCTEHFIRNDQGVGPAKWPRDIHECAPIQTGSVICCTLEAVDFQDHPPRDKELAKRAKKL
jgi:hypothetical protein